VRSLSAVTTLTSFARSPLFYETAETRLFQTRSPVCVYTAEIWLLPFDLCFYNNQGKRFSFVYNQNEEHYSCYAPFHNNYPTMLCQRKSGVQLYLVIKWNIKVRKKQMPLLHLNTSLRQETDVKSCRNSPYVDDTAHCQWTIVFVPNLYFFG
jgi:hypothetical protein